jgi:hypothetical protein
MKAARRGMSRELCKTLSLAPDGHWLEPPPGTCRIMLVAFEYRLRPHRKHPHSCSRVTNFFAENVKSRGTRDYGPCFRIDSLRIDAVGSTLEIRARRTYIAALFLTRKAHSHAAVVFIANADDAGPTSRRNRYSFAPGLTARFP